MDAFPITVHRKPGSDIALETEVLQTFVFFDYNALFISNRPFLTMRPFCKGFFLFSKQCLRLR